MAQLSLADAINRLPANENRLDTFVNGDENAAYQTPAGVEVPSVQNFLAQQEEKVNLLGSQFSSDTGTELVRGTWFGGSKAKVSALGGAGGASLIGFGQRSVADELLDRVNPLQHSAVGNGIADDTAALFAATSTGKVVDGLGLTYGVFGNFIPHANLKGLINCRLKQLNPSGTDRRTLFISGRNSFVIGNVKIDRNGNESGGMINDDAGIYIANCTNFYTYECEVFGGGAGTGITYQTCSYFEEVRNKVHDMKYVTNVVPPDDVINCFWYNNCHDFTITGSRAYDCGAVVSSFFTKTRSRGFAVSGSYNFRFYGTTADRVDQGHDATGGVGNHDFLYSGCVANDCNTYSFKAANSAFRGTYQSCVGVGARINFVVSGQSEASNPKPRDITYIRCTSVDAGKNPGYSGVPAQGFRIQSVPTVDTTYPRGIVYDGCTAIDNQLVPTMQNGFASDVATGTAPADINRLINNCQSSGHTSTATVGFNEVNNITGTSRVGGSSPRQVLVESGAVGNEKMWDVSYSNGVMKRRTRSDDDTFGSDFETVDRTGTVVDLLAWNATLMKFGGIDAASRFASFNSQGQYSQRFDDNGPATFQTFSNYGATGAGQGISIAWVIGFNGTSGATAARQRVVTTGIWTATASTQTAKWVLDLLNAGAVGAALEYDPTVGLRVGTSSALVAHPNGITKLQAYTVATLPSAATYVNSIIAVTDGTANKRMAISDGTNWRWPDGAIVS